MSVARTTRAKYVASLDEKARRVARNDLLSFTRYTHHNYFTNWHHRLLAKALDKFANGEIRRLIVTMPPRMGKSELVSRRLPAYLFGRNPNAEIIGCSYNQTLAESMSRDVQRIMDSHSYRRVFPETRLNSKNVVNDAKHQYKRTAGEFEIVGYRGSYRAVGVNVGVTGHGGNYIIIDDPVKNRKQADSETFQRTLWEWYTDDIYSRLEEPGSIIVMATRWHENDLTGQLLRHEREHEHADKWLKIDLPAVKVSDENELDPREIGEPIWPEFYEYTSEDADSDMSSEDAIHLARQELASYDFGHEPGDEKLVKRALGEYKKIQSNSPKGYASLYQNDPMPDGGAIFQEAWMQQRWAELPTLQGKWIQSWDLRAGGKGDDSSYAVGQLWFQPYNEPASAYLIDQVRAKWDFPDTLEKMVAMSKAPLWRKATAKIVENKADGRALIPTIKNKVAGVFGRDPGSSCKAARYEGVAPYFKAGNIYLPHAGWVDTDYIPELKKVPGGVNDDQADATEQAIDYLLVPDHDESELERWHSQWDN